MPVLADLVPSHFTMPPKRKPEEEEEEDTDDDYDEDVRLCGFCSAAYIYQKNSPTMMTMMTMETPSLLQRKKRLARIMIKIKIGDLEPRGLFQAALRGEKPKSETGQPIPEVNVSNEKSDKLKADHRGIEGSRLDVSFFSPQFPI